MRKGRRTHNATPENGLSGIAAPMLPRGAAAGACFCVETVHFASLFNGSGLTDSHGLRPAPRLNRPL